MSDDFPRATPDMDMPRNSAPTSPEKIELQFCVCNVRPLSDQTTSLEPIIPLTREEADRLLGRN
ncbi:MAG: hypothetical protein HQL40_17845 [Alphaproteobacteria bacterium]|nr:hypothetical protein [Alphaproteobacteria bacterium]MBF0335479.1 hypothetical protein [Alphaproteobacteria bacterium]